MREAFLAILSHMPDGVVVPFARSQALKSVGEGKEIVSGSFVVTLEAVAMGVDGAALVLSLVLRRAIAVAGGEV